MLGALVIGRLVMTRLAVACTAPPTTSLILLAPLSRDRLPDPPCANAAAALKMKNRIAASITLGRRRDLEIMLDLRGRKKIGY